MRGEGSPFGKLDSLTLSLFLLQLSLGRCFEEKVGGTKERGQLGIKACSLRGNKARVD